MQENNRTKAWLITSTVVLGLLALLVAPAVTAKSITGNVISYRPPTDTQTGRMVIKTGAGNVTLTVPKKADKTIRPGWTVTADYKVVKKIKKNKQGKKVVISVSNEATRKPTVKNSGTGDVFTESEGGSGGGEKAGGGSGGSGTKPGG